jgi:hypothetical protein
VAPQLEQGGPCNRGGVMGSSEGCKLAGLKPFKACAMAVTITARPRQHHAYGWEGLCPSNATGYATVGQSDGLASVSDLLSGLPNNLAERRCRCCVAFELLTLRCGTELWCITKACLPQWCAFFTALGFSLLYPY